MNSQELLRELFARHNIKEIAADQELSPALLYKWTESGNSRRVDPLERLARLCRTTQDRRLPDWLCAQLGGRFVPAAELQPLRPGERPATGCRVMQELGQLQAVLAGAPPCRPLSAPAGGGGGVGVGGAAGGHGTVSDGGRAGGRIQRSQARPSVSSFSTSAPLCASA